MYQRSLVAALTLVAALIVGTPASAQGGPPGFTINVAPENAEGRILINGVPISRFGGKDDRGMGIAANAGMWLNDGENTIAVEAKPTGTGAKTTVVIVRSMGEPPMFERTIEGAGRVEHKVTVNGHPRWSWFDAERWQGDNGALLAAVKALHEAYVRKDQAFVEANRRALEDDFTQVMGPLTEQEREEEKAFIAKARLAPLPASLVVTAHYGNRLFVVSRSDGGAPIQLSVPDVPGVSEIGQYWVRKGSQWTVVR